MSLRPAVMRRLMRELAQLKTEPPEGIRVSTPEDNLLDVTGIIEGPSGTPYEGGYFRVKFKFTDEFPASPPKCWTTTKVFHPNFSSSGEICVNTLKKDWQSSYGIEHILVTIKCLLIYPNPDSALDEEAGRLLQENYESFCERARLITKVHAAPKVRPVEFDTPSAASASSSTAATPTQSSSTSSMASLCVTRRIPSRKSLSPAPPSMLTSVPHPLQSSGTVSNAAVTASLSEKDKDREQNANENTVKGKTPSPSPLGPADANAPVVGLASAGTTTATKAVKRPAGASAGVAEKRKKALKRL